MFDVIDGGAGTDILNLVFADAKSNVAGVQVSNVENVVIKAADAVGEDAEAFDMSGWNGVKTVSISGAGSDAAITVESAASDSVTVSAKGVVTLTDETVAAIAVSTTGDNNTVDITAGDANVTVITTGADADVSITAADAGAVAVTVAESTVTLTADSADSVSVTGSSEVTLTVSDLGAVTLASAVDDNGTEDDLTDDTLVAFNSTITTVDNTALALTLNGADVGLEVIDNDAGESTTDDDLTTLNLTVAAATLGNVLDLTSDTITDITVAGAGDLELTVDTAAVTDIDASAATGDISVTIDGSTTSYAGGAGVDTVTLNDLPEEALDEDDEGTGVFATVIDGGDGDADVIEINATAAADAADIEDGAKLTTGFEKLSLTAFGADIVDATLFGIDYVVVDEGEGEGEATGGSVTIANEGTVEVTSGLTDIELIVDGADAVDADAADFSLNVVLTGGAVGIDAGGVTVDGVGAIALASNGTADEDGVVAAGNSVELAAAAATTLTVTGNAALDLTGSSLSAIETVDAADFDAGLTIDVSSSEAEDGVSITVGNGENTIVGSELNDTIVVGNGDNTITGGEGADAITLGTGVNTLVYATAGESTGLTVDTVTGFNANDLDADADAEAFNVFDFSALTDGDVTFLGAVANATLANTALEDVSNNEDFALQVIYVTGEKTLYADANGNGAIDAGDLAIELVGLVGTLTQNNFDIAV